MLRGGQELPLDEAGEHDGDPTSGTRWWVTSVGDTLVIGQPDVDRVVSTPDRPIAGPLAPAAIVAGPSNSAFGASVAALQLGDEVVWVIGAPDDSFARGAVYVVRDAAALPDETVVDDSALLVRGTSPGDRIGERITPCADVTGDGIADLAISIPWFALPDDPGFPDPDARIPELAGALLLVSSEDVLAAGGEPAPPWDLGRLWWGTELGEGAGTSVACDRDLSGDGIADVVVGSPWAAGTTGRITVHLGGSALPDDGPLPDGALRTVDGPDSEGWFGIALATVGDPPNTRVAVGSAGSVAGAGRVHVYPGEGELANPDRLNPRRTATFLAPAGRSLPDHFGRWLVSGDLDGDGLGDLVIGAPDYRSGPDGFDTGGVWLFPGSGADAWSLTTEAETAAQIRLGQHAFQRLGRAPHVADLDGDGLDDLVLPTREAL